MQAGAAMKATKALRRSLVQFRTHPLRTSLALLGMVLGVGSVVGMVSIGEGAQREILTSIEALGGNVVHIKAKDVSEERIAELVNDSRGLNRNDLAALKAHRRGHQGAPPGRAGRTWACPICRCRPTR